MNLQAIYHLPKSNYCYAYDKDTIHIRLRGDKDDIKRIILVYGDKYIWEESKRELPMELSCADEKFDYFSTSIIPLNKRLTYYFIIEGEREKLYYTEMGFSKNLNPDDVYKYGFNYPYINEIDVHKVPEWVKDAVFYQIFPERFYNGDKSNDPENIEPWGKLPERDSFFGGDIKGIIEKIDYLTELGINAIYMTPIFESPTNHKYDTKDYKKIDPHFGDLETVKTLVKRCHDRGIKVVFDAVFNHSGHIFFAFQDVIQKGKASPYFDWFHIKECPITIEPLSYETFAFAKNMPKLNTANPEVKEYLLDVARYWIEEVNIDGWRLDVANEIDHHFWREFRQVVKNAKEDAYIVGEIWHNSLPWLMGDQFDAIMNYPFTNVCIEYFAQESINEKKFREGINRTIMSNTQQVNEVMLNLLDSHDTSRFLTKSKGDINKLKLASVFQLTYAGTPCIYYGTEIGMEGGEDPDCMRCMEWDRDKWDMELFTHYRTLIGIRNKYTPLRRGSFKWVKTEEDVIGFVREYKDEKVYVFINNSRNKSNLKLAIDKKYCLDAAQGRSIQSDGNIVNFTILPHQYKILFVKN